VPAVSGVGVARDDVIVPNFIFDSITIDDDFLWITPDPVEDNGFVNLSSLSNEESEPLVRLE